MDTQPCFRLLSTRFVINIRKGKLFVISAPSGAGKSTLIAGVLPLFPDMLYSVSCTTRPPRSGETDGISYYFLDEERFKAMTENGEFLEWKTVHGNFYGTPAKPVQEALTAGRRMVLDIDVQGALEVFAKVSEAVGIFVTAPNLTALEERLRRRSTETEESIGIRLKNAVAEMAYGDTFKYQVVNDDLDRAVLDLAAVIRSEFKCCRDMQSSHVE
ncbi:MAG: guanylate kinase [Desulfomonile sp.]